MFTRMGAAARIQVAVPVRIHNPKTFTTHRLRQRRVQTPRKHVSGDTADPIVHSVRLLSFEVAKLPAKPRQRLRRNGATMVGNGRNPVPFFTYAIAVPRRQGGRPGLLTRADRDEETFLHRSRARSRIIPHPTSLAAARPDPPPAMNRVRTGSRLNREPRRIRKGRLPELG